MGNLDSMGFNRPVGNTEAEALRPEKVLKTDRNVDRGTSGKRTYTPESQGVVQSKAGLFHHPV